MAIARGALVLIILFNKLIQYFVYAFVAEHLKAVYPLLINIPCGYDEALLFCSEKLIGIFKQCDPLMSVLTISAFHNKSIAGIKNTAAYLRKRLRYWRLQADQEKIPLWPANVGDMMFPSDFLQTFPSPSWTIPKLGNDLRYKRVTIVSK